LGSVCCFGCEVGFFRVFFCRGKSPKELGDWVTKLVLWLNPFFVKNILHPRNGFFSPIGLNLTSGTSGEKRLSCISAE
jgi:hypothetical protein